MNTKLDPAGTPALPKGVMFNAYPDSIGETLSDTVNVLQKPELRDTFSLLYVLPTFFHSDLDRGFSIIDYDRNEELASEEDLEALKALNIGLKFDLVVNHLSVGSPQFQDLVKHGAESRYKDFFINWNEFWSGEGEVGSDGYIVPKKEHLDKLFMRKPDLPILTVRFPDGSERPFWNTFYQKVSYASVQPDDFAGIEGIGPESAVELAALFNAAIRSSGDWRAVDLGAFASQKDALFEVIERKREYLGQMDLNARSEQVWAYYDDTLAKLADFGCQLVRLDAFAYLHKEPGSANFFNKPGTWDYLHRLRRLAADHGLLLLPEVHGEYGRHLYEEVANEGFPVYDFFFPGLLIDALDRGTNTHLVAWIQEIQAKKIQTVNMLGCHDGIPVLDLSGKMVDGVWQQGLLSNDEIEAVIQRVLERGGRVKNLYGADGKKISYYQVNATFFSALGEDESKLRLARAIQIFMPGIPQVWYLDLFAGANDYAAADRGGPGGHKEINRTTLSLSTIEERLQWPVVRDQLDLLRLRNTCPAFDGELTIEACEAHEMRLKWVHGDVSAELSADLRDGRFQITVRDGVGPESTLSYAP